MNEEDKQAASTAIHKNSREIKEIFDQITNDSEAFWNKLNKDEQLSVFCAVVRRICKGELDESKSYRGILYDTFGWDAGSYAAALMAGYMGLHNSIYQFDDIIHVFECTLKELGLVVEDKAIKDALAKHFL